MTHTDLTTLQERWGDVVAACDRRNRQAASLLLLSHPVSVTPFGNGYVQVVLETRFAQHRETMSEQAGRLAIQGAIETVLGKVTMIDVRLRGGKDASLNVAPSGGRITSQRARALSRTAGNKGRVTSIRTQYGGVEFRSKLEAGFAELFDVARIDWEFEPEGFNLAGLWYLPDFWLPDLRIFVEVKGILDANAEEKATRLAEAAKENNITVLIVQKLRPCAIPGLSQRYIAGTLVSDGQLFEAAMILARCPVCRGASWKAPGIRRCAGCGAEMAPDQFQPIALKGR